MLTNSQYLEVALLSQLVSMPVDFVKTQLQVTGKFEKLPWRSQYIGSDAVLLKGMLILYIKQKVYKSTYDSDVTYLLPSMSLISLLFNPFDHILVKMQTGHLSENVKIGNTFDTLNYIIAKQGILGLYRGAFPNFCKNFSCFASGYFVNMEIVPYYVIFWKYFLGLMSLIPSVIISHPFDVVKAHMQKVDEKGLNFRKCCLDIYRNFGIAGFYNGVFQAYGRIGFVYICTLTCMEMNQLNS